MSLLRTSSIRVGSILVFTGAPPEDGQTFLWGNPQHFDLQARDVVQVLEIHRRDGTSWARVLVAVIKGQCTGRVGQVSINMEARRQRSWQTLTMSGSMAPARVAAKSGAHRKAKVGEAATHPATKEAKERKNTGS
jgi:hypothetical protein